MSTKRKTFITDVILWSKCYFCIPTSTEGGHSGLCSDRVVEFLIGITNPTPFFPLRNKILLWFSNSLVRHCTRKTWYVSGQRIRSRSIHFVWQHLVLITRFILFPALQFSPRSPCLTAELSCNSKRFSGLSDTLWIYLPRFPVFSYLWNEIERKRPLSFSVQTVLRTNWILSIYSAFSNSIFWERIIKLPILCNLSG